MDESKPTVIKFSFKSRLHLLIFHSNPGYIYQIFIQIQALLDIQEFYELTLMDENKPNAIKASEAIEMASRWEVGQGPFGKPMGPAGGPNNDTGPDALAMAAAAAAVAQAKKDVSISLFMTFTSVTQSLSQYVTIVSVCCVL